MFCPLSPIRPQTEKPYECCREQCAWYDTVARSCAVLTISKATRAMAGRMDDMLVSGLPINQ